MFLHTLHVFPLTRCAVSSSATRGRHRLLTSLFLCFSPVAAVLLVAFSARPSALQHLCPTRTHETPRITAISPPTNPTPCTRLNRAGDASRRSPDRLIPPTHVLKHTWISTVQNGEPADRHGSGNALLSAQFPVAARGGDRTGLGGQDLAAVPAEAEGVRRDHPHERLQHREGQGGGGGVARRQLPGVGRGRPGQAPPAVEVLHQAHGRHRLRGGLDGAGADGGGAGGAAQDHPHLGEPGRARAGPGQQAGPGERAVGRRGGEDAGGARAGRAHAAPRAGLQRRGRPGAAGRTGEAPRNDREEEENGQAQQNEEEVNGGAARTLSSGRLSTASVLNGLLNGRTIRAKLNRAAASGRRGG